VIKSLTEQERTIESTRREWSANATRQARVASELSAEDFAKRSGVGESRQLSFERPDESPRSREPRVQLDKIVAWPFVSLLALCRGLLGTRAVVIEVTATKTTLDEAAGTLTKENSEAVLASLTKARTPGNMRNLEREAMELAQVALGVAMAAREEAEKAEAMVIAPLRSVKAGER
jgi:hypothetical protein